MKKVFSFVFVALLSITLVGCTININSSDKKEKDEKKDKYSCEELVELYVKAYNEEKPELIKEVFPDFMVKELDSELNVESIQRAKSYYGKNTKMTAKATCTKKMDDEWLEENNAILKKYYNTDVKALECYELEGTMTIKGSDDEHTGEIEEMWYCNFDGQWRLMAG